jgi:hypothetical protein
MSKKTLAVDAPFSLEVSDEPLAIEPEVVDDNPIDHEMVHNALFPTAMAKTLATIMMEIDPIDAGAKDKYVII